MADIYPIPPVTTPAHALMLSLLHDDIVLIQVVGPTGDIEAVGRTTYGALCDLYDGNAWALVAGDISLVRKADHRFQARVMQRQIAVRVDIEDFRQSLDRLQVDRLPR